MPATGFSMRTPAFRRLRVLPHTVAMEDEPLDSRISETMRIVYGKLSFFGMTMLMARSARCPCPISRRPGEPSRPTSPTENGGKL